MAEAAERTVQNVVFDMGGVLLRWDPLSFPLAFTDSVEDARAVCEALFESTQWSLLDANAISSEAMLMCAHERLPERLWGLADRCFEEFPALQPVIESTNELARRLKDAGYGIYVLSNVSLRFREEFEPRIPLCSFYDGALTSAEEKLMKPDPAIFGLFCERFMVEPSSCLFVDDSDLNCTGARRAGWQAFHYTGDTAALEERLHALGAREF